MRYAVSWITCIVLVTVAVGYATRTFAQEPFGDANGEDTVNSRDYVILFEHFTQDTTRGVVDGDFDGSGRVNALDYVIFFTTFGQTRSNSLTLTPTPTSTPAPTPTVASCAQACTSANQCSSGTCQGLTSIFVGTDIMLKSTRPAVATDYDWMNEDQTIYIAAGNWRVMEASGGTSVYNIVSRSAGVLNVYLYQITAPEPQLDPRVLLLQKSLSIAAGQVTSVEVSVPNCGRYAVNFGSPMVVGTAYHVNPASPDYFWGDGDLRFACTGCCQ